MKAILADCVDLLAGRRVVVVGDLTLDEYLYGQATRLSREAPVPVLELTRREMILGGAANPARNVVALGSQAVQIGIIGDDPEGRHIRTLLSEAGIAPDGLVLSRQRPTTRKTRILAEDSPRAPQQVARVDRLERRSLDSDEEELVIAALHASVPQADVVICSDYQTGLLTPRVVAAIRELCRNHRVLFTVDAQGNSHYYRGADLFRCNNLEASAALGRRLEGEEAFQSGLEALQALIEARLVMVTRGPQGVALVGVTTPYLALPAVQVSEVYDPTGAGDTFIAVAALALSSGMQPLEIAHLANTAAAQVVRRVGNAVVTRDELRAVLQPEN
jgi:rfaE bifunctional protein kinase chain/domain